MAALVVQVTDAVEGLRYPLIVKHHNGYASVGMGRDCKACTPEQLVAQVRGPGLKASQQQGLWASA